MLEDKSTTPGNKTGKWRLVVNAKTALRDCYHVSVSTNDVTCCQNPKKREMSSSMLETTRNTSIIPSTPTLVLFAPAKLPQFYKATAEMSCLSWIYNAAVGSWLFIFKAQKPKRTTTVYRLRKERSRPRLMLEYHNPNGFAQGPQNRASMIECSVETWNRCVHILIIY